MGEESYWGERKEMHAALREKYPKLFSLMTPESKMPIMFGIECGQGWYKILGELFEELSKYDVVLHQVKEKFGGLRVYWVGAVSDEEDAVIDKLVDAAEEKCWNTCENCGEPGKPMVIRGWKYTSCGRCSETKDFKEREALLNKLKKEGKLLTPYDLMFGKVK